MTVAARHTHQRGWYRTRRRVGAVVRYIAMLVALGIVLFPIYWMLLSTIQPQQYVLTWPPPLLPKGFDLSSLVYDFTKQPIGLWLFHSSVVSLVTVVITLVLAVPGAFLLSKLRWRGVAVFGFCLLFTQMMPGAIIIVPLLQIYRTLGLENNLLALPLIYAGFTMPLGCWVLKTSYDGVPREVYEAALVDGCGPMRALIHILVPLSKPGLIAVAVVAYFNAWNDYLFASAFITDPALYTAGEGLASFITAGNTALYELIGAGAVFAVIPVILYLLVQRHVVRGLTAGAVRG